MGKLASGKREKTTEEGNKEGRLKERESESSRRHSERNFSSGSIKKSFTDDKTLNKIFFCLRGLEAAGCLPHTQNLFLM